MQDTLLKPNGHEPALGGESERHSGREPLLGGSRRAEADLGRVQALITVELAAERREMFAFIRRLGQTRAYSRELIQVIKPHARQRTGNWHGSFTLTQRRLAIDALAALGGAEALEPLLAALTDTNYQVRQAAETALTAIRARLDPAELKSKKALGALVEALGSPTLAARKMAARILADTPAEVVLGALLRDGLGSTAWQARREAAWALGQLGDRRAAARLVAGLEDDAPEVRTGCAWALGQLNAPATIPALSRSLSDPDETVRAAAVAAIGAQAGRLSWLDMEFQASLDLLVRTLEADRELSVKHAALDALAEINAPQARAALRAVMG